MLKFLLAFHGAADKLGGCEFLTAKNRNVAQLVKALP
jgi:hypothetical protein